MRMGNLLWVKTIGSSNIDEGSDITIDMNGDLLISGIFEGTVDFDPGPANFNITSNGGIDAFIEKLDTNGNFIWVKTFGGNSSSLAYADVPNAIATDLIGNIYTIGNFRDCDFDPSAGVFNLRSNSLDDVFVQKLDSNGNFVWAKSFGGSIQDSGNDILVDEFGNIHSTGTYSDSVDFDPDTSSFILRSTQPSCYIQKLKQGTCSNLTLIYDSVLNVTCIDSGLAIVHAINGQTPYSYSWNTLPPISDSIAFFDSSGIFTITIIDSVNCQSQSSIIINSYNSGPGYDLNANLIGSNFRTGFSARVWLDAFNNRCADTSGQLFLVLDNLVSFDSSTIAPDQINGDTLIWNFNGLTYDSVHLKPQVFLKVDSTAAIGDMVDLEISIYPISGDIDSVNNWKFYQFPIINSYDPNDKQVYPQGECIEKYVLNDQVLTYMIRFQNTGNADAINVHIIDTVAMELDLKSINVIGSSHEMYTELLAENVLDFRFDNIYLPDSASNEPASHGFVIFEILPKNDVIDGVLVENKSEIYFDFNQAIVTNKVSNTLVEIIPECTTTALIENINNDSVIIYPNPTSDNLNVVTSMQDIHLVFIRDISGRKYNFSKTLSNTIDVHLLPKGIYFATFLTNSRVIVRKFIKI